MKVFRYMAAAAAGAAMAYLFDPVSGRGRRARMRDQSAAMTRDAVEGVATKARYEAGRARGLIHEMQGSDDWPADDAELLQKVRSEAVGPSRVDPGDIEIHIDGGEVVIRGSSSNPDDIKDLIDRIESVTGVHRVRNELSPT